MTFAKAASENRVSRSSAAGLAHPWARTSKVDLFRTVSHASAKSGAVLVKLSGVRTEPGGRHARCSSNMVAIRELVARKPSRPVGTENSWHVAP